MERKNKGGRPPGSRDYRPVILAALEKFKVWELIAEEWERSADQFKPQQRMTFLLQMAELGLKASPKDINVDNQSVVMLVIKGLNQPGEIEGEVLDSITSVDNDEKALVGHNDNDDKDG